MNSPFEDFPWLEKTVGPFCSRFCENFEQLMSTAAFEFHRKPTMISRAWDLPLLYRQTTIILKVYEEPTNLTHPNCEQCRCNGWQHHPVSRRKIHFILPSSSSEIVFESKMHVLHGIVHLNGYGHLMRINGLEGGSEYLRGSQLIVLWDSLCQLLRVRECTVEDVSNRRGMQLRLLLPIARKSTFYMRHGYEFGRGQFAVQKKDWIQAVEELHQTSLQDLLVDFAGVDETIQRIILRYQGHGDERPMTLGALLDSMLMLTENEYCALQFCLHLLSRKEPTSEELNSLTNTELAPPCKIEPSSENGVYDNGLIAKEETEETEVIDKRPLMEVSPTPESSFLESTIPDQKPSYSGKLTPSQDDSLSPMMEDETDGSREESHHQMDESIILKTPRKYKKRIPVDDPGDLVKPRISPFNAASLFEGSRKYSATKMMEIIRITLGVLQCYENRWVRLQELRDILYDTAHDRVLADFVLGRMANSTVNGFSIFKQRSKIARCNYYLFEKYEGADRAQYREAFLDQIDESYSHSTTAMSTTGMSMTTSAYPSPGPENVNGHSLARFEEYLGLLFKWMCMQPNVSIGRGPNKNKPKPKTKRKEPENDKDGIFKYSTAGSGYTGMIRNVRATRASISNACRQRRFSVDEERRIKQPWIERYPSEVAASLEEFRLSGQRPGVKFSAKKNVLVDLLYLYQSIIETYKPLTEAHKTALKLQNSPKYTQVLKDTKFFVKKFDTDVKRQGTENGVSSDIHLVCQVVLDPTIPPGHMNARMKDEMPSFLTTPPPAEEIWVPAGSNVVTIKHAVEEVFSKIYTMFEMWSVSALSNLRLENNVLESSSDTVVEVKGHMFRPELELRHSGGIEDWEVLCPCGTRDDDGARMLCCDICSVWMHTRCAGFRDDSDVPSFFQCPHCLRKNTT